MTGPVRDTRAMIAGMDPALDPRDWCFVTVDNPQLALDLMPHALASFREEEGLSLIVPYEIAEAREIETIAFSRIVLQVPSALDGVGLTAAVSGALAEAAIACNIVAATHHDHAFVPKVDAQRALDILVACSQSV